MPSEYCSNNPSDPNCAWDSNYDPSGGGTYGGGYGGGTWGGGGSVNIPQGVGNAGGWPGGAQGQLSQILNSILSGVALIQGANYVPTPLQSGQLPQGASSQQPPTIIYQGGGAGNYGGGGGNTAGNFQRFLEQNKGAVILGLIGVGLFMMKPPQRAR